MTGDVIQFNGYIDNTNGKDIITDAAVQFIDRRWKISSGGAIRNHVMNNFVLFTIPGPIQKGQNQPFSFTATIPPGIVFSTAIGSILSRYQVLNISSSTGCCATGPSC